MRSQIKHHAESTGHDIHPAYSEILERGVANKQKRLFLESFHSALEPNAANERQPFPRAYMPLITSIKQQKQYNSRTQRAS